MKLVSSGVKILSLSFLLFPSLSFSQSNILIEGFAQWQADRIERIALDQTIFGMMENDYVEAFFPNTTEAVNSYGRGTSTQRLIPLIQTTIRNDIKVVETTFTMCIKAYINEIKVDIDSGDAERITLALNKLESFNSTLTGINNSPDNTMIGYTKAVPALYSDFRRWVCGSTTKTQKDSIENGKIDLLNTAEILPAELSASKANEKAKVSLKAYSRYEDNLRRITSAKQSH